uniref:YqaJ viral recombinase domain-containing protein n=1 Tax=Pectinophora gossypiella TaxID=13191 RepID=A0A1E1W812_PECGO
MILCISGVIEEENSILEIKCFPSLARNNQDIFSAAKDRKNFPLLVDDTGALQINKKHNYYYQIQGQLRVSKMMKCYFIGYVSPSFDITVLEVQRDENFIKNMMPKLVTFYKNCILPEVVLRRVTKKQKCIDISIMW